MHPYADNYIIVIPMEDELLHAFDKPFCWDKTCLCHDDQTLFRETEQFVREGLMTTTEAIMFIAGKTV